MNPRPRHAWLTVLAVLAALVPAGHAATIGFSGTMHTANLTAFPWVFSTTMWGSVETAGGTGSSTSGFASLAALNPSLITFSLGDLELSSHLSPGTSTSGFEYYSEVDASVTPFNLYYDGALWATGTTSFLQSDVANKNSTTATGTGAVYLTAPGLDPAFYNEVMNITGGTGLLQIAVSNFSAVDNAGNFTMVGSLAATPEPSRLLLLGLGLLPTLLRRRPSRAV